MFIVRLLKHILGGFALILASVALLVMWIAATPSGTSWAMNRVKGLAISTGLENLAFSDIDGTLLDGLQLSELALAAPGLQLKVAEVSFTWRPWELSENHLHFTSLVVRTLELVYRAQTDSEPAEPLTREMLQSMIFSLPVSISLDALDARDIAMDINGSAVSLEEVSGNLDLNAEQLDLSDLLVRAAGDISGEIAADLTMDNALALSSTIDWQTTLDDRLWQGAITVNGDPAALDISHILMQPLSLQTAGTVNAGLFPGSGLQLELQHTLPFVDLGLFGQPGMQLMDAAVNTSGSLQQLQINGRSGFSAEEYALQGQADFDLLYGDNSLIITRLDVDSNQAGMQLDGELGLSPLDVQLNWIVRNLDTAQRLPQLRAENLQGNGTVSLQVDDNGVDAEIGITAINGTIDGRPLQVSGSASLANSVLDSIDLQAESAQNSVLISGALQPSFDLDWEIRLPALAQLWEGLQGQVNGTGTLRGDAENPEINGNLLGTGFSLPLNGQTLVLDRVSLSALYENASNDLDFKLGLLSLMQADAEPVVLLSGGEISLQGTPLSHQLQLSLGNNNETVDLSLQGGLSDGNWSGAISSGTVNSRYGNWSLQDVSSLLYSNGAATMQEACWLISADDLQVCMEASLHPESGVDATLTLSGFPLDWFNTQQDENGQVVSSRTVPAGIDALQQQFALHLPPSLQIEGSVNLSASIAGFQQGSWSRLAVNAQPINVGMVVSQSTESEFQTLVPQIQRFTFHDFSASTSNVSGLWQSELGFQVSRETELGQDLQGGFSAGGTLDADDRLDGIVDFDFNDLAWLETMVPGLRNPRGSLFGTVMLGGSPGEPQFRTSLQLSDGAFNLPNFGLALHDVSITLQSPDGAINNNLLEIYANAKSGQGEIGIVASLADYLLDTRSISARINGTDFSMFDADYATIVLSPQLELSLAQQGVEIRGELTLTDSYVDLAGMFGDVGNNAVGVSRDVVVLDKSGETQGRGNEVPLAMDVTLNVGDSVKLGGFGLDVSLNGMLALEQEAGRSLLAYGELSIPQGSYEIYNQQLNARDGRLLFFGNPANPVVDIRAYRETSNAEVGMLLSGPVNNIQGELYSTPTLPESEILALLVTGKSFKNVESQDGDALLNAITNFGIEKGQGLTSMVSSQLGLDSVSVSGGANYRDSSLGIGKYITPRLLLQYEVGFFDRQNVLSIDYTLTDNLKLEVRTGISQSVDISYTIEKD